MSPDQLLAEVRALVLRELEGLDASRLVLRLDDVGEQSVFVVARLGECGAVMVARVYEVDLCSEGAVPWLTSTTSPHRRQLHLPIGP